MSIRSAFVASVFFYLQGLSFFFFPLFLELLIIFFLKVRFIFLAFMQASGSMSPRMQLLRERAAIHGSISHVSMILYIAMKHDQV